MNHLFFIYLNFALNSISEHLFINALASKTQRFRNW